VGFGLFFLGGFVHFCGCVVGVSFGGGGVWLLSPPYFLLASQVINHLFLPLNLRRAPGRYLGPI